MSLGDDDVRAQRHGLRPEGEHPGRPGGVHRKLLGSDPADRFWSLSYRVQSVIEPDMSILAKVEIMQHQTMAQQYMQSRSVSGKADTPARGPG